MPIFVFPPNRSVSLLELFVGGGRRRKIPGGVEAEPVASSDEPAEGADLTGVTAMALLNSDIPPETPEPGEETESIPATQK
ncbi:MAG: hypothetical protein UX38_C0005G0028 [Microgenomates group bacterium GW2011_GWC1_46_16]|uniref:Uncharacterized protein n=2 Tax=Candidatus Collieribacteriota TaxID=1752725 RepID=A0A1F5FYV4_9BACT|nr:MAG: hypothetical protein UX32_C0007G0009 [Microgenomates group bacterium GW2011_GWF1_46_12]KKU26525.1 MAG: hypothetical protein UX38_C0005G0028 [Microgenomates group bacterium GW2011_GWC1_46_16]KKU28212.1 MAG: hypothetical protein UX40_C0002G0052 [Microgenomates group bacterium GW2011_GWF2_46_18]KKU43573.1 MAG: hypothetical protein UX59_C0014G0005 [Microgenomates group bacterium GW2011_GWA1_46_7]KKU45133.1 MAG: hypothetical protein UX63_C0011G0005 [Microgenomates group bacterium GW2011_GWB1